MSCDQDSDHGAVLAVEGLPFSSAKIAVALQRRGNCENAKSILVDLSEKFPDESQISVWLGDVFFSLQDYSQSLTCYNKALDVKSGQLSVLVRKGDCLYQLGEFEQAIDWYRRAVVEFKDDGSLTQPECRRKLAAALTDWGVRRKLEGDLTRALSCSDAAIQADPTYATAYYNLAVLYSDMREQFPSVSHWLGHHAKSLYMKALELSPSHVEVLNNLGVMCKAEGNLDVAVQCYRLALRIRPDFEISKKNLASVLSCQGCEARTLGNSKKARSLFKEALCVDPSLADAHYNLAVSYMDSQQLNKAILFFNLAIRFKPDFVAALHNLGVIYKDLNQFDRSLSFYKKALAVDPLLPQTLNNVAVIHTIIGQSQAAYEEVSQAIKLNTQYIEAYNNLGVICRDLGNVEEAIEAYDECLAFDVTLANPNQNRLLAMNYLDSISVNEVFLSSLRWGSRLMKSVTQYTRWKCPSLDDSRQLHIGYISPDFFTHSVSYFIEGPLRLHSNVRVTLYSKTVREDSRTELFQGMGHEWRNMVGISDSDTAAIIHEDKIDILVELAGHTSGNSLEVLARKPAPIQCSWIGYPNTTGLETIDFRITDSVVDPINTQQPYVEKLVRLPKCFLCYTPPVDLPKVSPVSACNTAGFITFGTFNALAKLDERLIRCWKQILESVPLSRLLLKAKPFTSSTAKKTFRSKLEGCGLDTSRVDLLPLASGMREHLSMYDLLDIALDTFPYAGTTTTCEALIMAVPVISLAGQNCHAQNVGASLLQHAGLPDLVARTEAEYVDAAVKLARNPARLNEIRKTLRAQFVGSDVCDAKKFTNQLETLYEFMYSECAKSM